MQCDLAIAAGATTLIAGGMKCGAFNNDPLLVSYLQMLVLQEEAYKNLNVQFYVPDDQFGNFKHFNFCFNHFEELRQGEFGKKISELANPAKEKNASAYSYQTLVNNCHNTCKALEKKRMKKLLLHSKQAFLLEIIYKI